MATATKDGRDLTRHPGRQKGSGSMEFLIFEDNGGRYQWKIVDGDGESLAQCGSFASYDEAEQAARVVREKARTARLERRHASDPPVDLATRREAARDDNSDPERWLDESGDYER